MRRPAAWRWLLGAVLGDAPALRRDQLAAYAASRSAQGDHAQLRIGPRRFGLRFDAISSAEGAHRILSEDARSYIKDAPAFREFIALLGDGLVTLNGEEWRRHRRIIQPLFTPRAVQAHLATVIADAEAFVADCGDTADRCGSIDLFEHSMEYALQVLGTAVFGDDITNATDVLNRNLPVMNEYGAKRALAPIRIPMWVPTPTNVRLRRARREMWRLVDQLVADRRAHPRPGAGDLLSRLLSARDADDGASLTDDDVRAETLIFLAAGHETTGTSLAFTLHLIGCHPEVQAKLRHEVQRVVGDEPLEPRHLGLLSYTRRVVDESTRLYPTVHTLVRQAAQDTDVRGRAVPAGRIMAVSIYGIHHDPDLWTDPERFDPDRFADSPGEHAAERHRHLPFGEGQRKCIGSHLALAELVLAAAALVRSYELVTPHTAPDLEVGLSLRPAGPMPCRLAPVPSPTAAG